MVRNTPFSSSQEHMSDSRSSSPPPVTRPRQPAPARSATGTIASDDKARIKSTITLAKGPLLARRTADDGGTVSDYDRAGNALACGLGWFSIAVGIAQIAAAGRMTKCLGLDSSTRPLIRSCGCRALGSGIGLLMSERPAKRGKWLWSRVAGNALDLAALAPALRTSNARRNRVAYTMAALAGVTALDLLCAMRMSSKGRKARAAVS
ncbi:MAG: hypothetical protein SGJ11_00720 [Phycisphaerae bacterium]|nr:hypothetical protein [Phycisphaerae bacterium]